MLRLREWREKRGLSLRKLAELSGVHYVMIARLQTGQGDPQLSTLLKLCRVLDITLNDLIPQTPSKGGAHGGTGRKAKR
jgi:transcriptional regulator with XRE-family HTH domain